MKKKALFSCCALLVLFSLLAVAGSPLAQEKQNADQGDAAKPAATRRAPRGRLPNYYRQVVTPTQREKIYTLQASYAEKIEVLEKQIAELEAKRDAEVEALLTPEQREKVKALAEEARKRRAERAAERAGTAEPPAAEAKPADK